MAHLDHKGPENTGSQTGRSLGKCISSSIHEKNQLSLLGKGQGKRRHSGGGVGKGKRLKYNTNTI